MPSAVAEIIVVRTTIILFVFCGLSVWPSSLDVVTPLLANVAVFCTGPFSPALASFRGTTGRISLRPVSRACRLLDSRSRVLLIFPFLPPSSPLLTPSFGLPLHLGSTLFFLVAAALRLQYAHVIIATARLHEDDTHNQKQSAPTEVG